MTMSKINKYANIYDKDGNLLRKAPLKDVTIGELEEMLDNYKGDKNDFEYLNMQWYLIQLYQKYGNPHKQDIIDKINEYAKTHEADDEVREALRAVGDALQTEGGEETEEPTPEEEVQEAPKYDVNTLATEDIEYEAA